MKRIDKCKICSGKLKRELSISDYRYKKKFEGAYYRCNHCDVLILNPFPEKKEIGDLYPEEYSVHLDYKTKKESEFKKHLRTKKWFRKLFMNPFYDVPGKKLFEVGAANGRHLYELKKWGWEVSGIEPDNQAIKYAQRIGINVEYEYAESFNTNEKYDVILLLNVLEHLENPVKSLNNIYKHMKPGSRLIIEVPNTDSLGFRIFKNKWYLLDPPRHLYNYNKKSLLNLTKKQKFKLISIKYHTNLYSFIRSYHIKQNIRPKEYRYKILDITFGNIIKLLNLTKYGDSIRIIVKK